MKSNTVPQDSNLHSLRHNSKVQTNRSNCDSAIHALFFEKWAEKSKNRHNGVLTTELSPKGVGLEPTTSGVTGEVTVSCTAAL